MASSTRGIQIGNAWFQRKMNLRPQHRGVHLVTEEILRQMPELCQFSVGLCHLQILHTSASLALNESWDPDVRDDMEMMLNKIVPEVGSLFSRVSSLKRQLLATELIERRSNDPKTYLERSCSRQKYFKDVRYRWLTSAERLYLRMKRNLEILVSIIVTRCGKRDLMAKYLKRRKTHLKVRNTMGLPYRHSCEGPDDMPAHVKACFLGSSLTIPITDGKLNLGTWQGIWLCEHRDHAGSRKLVVTLNGCLHDSTRSPISPISPLSSTSS